MFLFKFKILAIVHLVKKAVRPWSEDMEELVKQGLQLKHPRCLIV